MKREFLVNIVLLVLINLLVKLTYIFGIEVEVQNTIGPESYGLFLALYNFTYLFTFINDPGIHSYNVTEIASHRSTLGFHLPRILGVKLVVGLLFIIAVGIGAWIIGYGSSVLPFLWKVTLIHILSSFFLYFRSNLSAVGKYRQDSLISALDKVLMIFILGGMLLSKDKFQLQDFLNGQILAFSLAILVAYYLVGRGLQFTWPVFDWAYAKKLLKASFPFALILLLMSSYTKLDGVMLERMLPDGEYQTGIYAASLRYMEAARMVAYLVAGLLLPMYTAAKNKKEIESLMDISFRVLMVLVCTIVSIGITFRSKFMGIYDIYDVQYDSLMLWHLLSFLCIGLSFVFGTLLLSKRKLKNLNILFACGIVLNFLLNVYLVPTYKASGVAFATFITELCMFLGQIFIATYEFKLKLKVPLMIRSVCYLGLQILVCLVARQLLDIQYWIYIIILLAGNSIILSHFLHVFKLQNLLELVTQVKQKGPIS